MTFTDIEAFIDHWHHAVADVLEEIEEKRQLPTLARYLKEEIERTPALRNLATSPLLCAMLCALNREHPKHLPTDRIELYNACCALLIQRRDLARGIALSEYPALALSYRQKYILLTDLAYHLLKNGWSEVPIIRAEERFARKLTTMQNIPQQISGADIRHLL